MAFFTFDCHYQVCASTGSWFMIVIGSHDAEIKGRWVPTSVCKVLVRDVNCDVAFVSSVKCMVWL